MNKPPETRGSAIMELEHSPHLVERQLLGATVVTLRRAEAAFAICATYSSLPPLFNYAGSLQSR
jgi:hypothetical protein